MKKIFKNISGLKYEYLLALLFVVLFLFVAGGSIKGWNMLRNSNKSTILSLVKGNESEEKIKEKYLISENIEKELDKMIELGLIETGSTNLYPKPGLNYSKLDSAEKNILSILYTHRDVTTDNIGKIYLKEYFDQDYQDLLKDNILAKRVDGTVIRENRFSSNEIFFVFMTVVFYTTVLGRMILDYKRIKELKFFEIQVLDIKDYSELNEKIENLDEKSAIKKVWKNYIDTLYIKDNRKYETVDSDLFFNFNTLYKEQVRYRVFTYIPQFLVGVGMLGTFFGLSSGLSQLNLSSVEAIETGVGSLLGGVKTAFYTSLFGLGYSIWLSYFINSYIGEIERIISAIQEKLSSLTKKSVAEKSFDLIIDSLEKIKSSNNDMATTLANKIDMMSQDLNTNINNFSSSIGGNFSTELSGALDKIFTEDLIKNMERSLGTISEVFLVNAEKMEDFKNEMVETANHLHELKISYSNVITETAQLGNSFNSTMEKVNGDLSNLTMEINKVSEKYEKTGAQLDKILTEITSNQEATSKISKDNRELMEVAASLIENSKEILDVEKSLEDVWKNYEISFKEANKKLGDNLIEYRDSLEDTNSRLHTVLKNNSDEYTENIKAKTIDYTREIRQGLTALLNDYDNSLSTVINKFNGVLLNFNENMNTFSELLVETKEIMERNIEDSESKKEQKELREEEGLDE